MNSLGQWKLLQLSLRLCFLALPLATYFLQLL